MNFVQRSILNITSRLSRCFLNQCDYLLNVPKIYGVTSTRNFHEIKNIYFHRHSYYRDIFRSYSKAKDKGKDKTSKKRKDGKISVDSKQLATVFDVEELTSELNNIVDELKDDFVKNVSIRSSVGSIETLKVHHDGKDYELQELAQIVRKNPKTIILNLTSFPQTIPDVLKAISMSGLNLNPQQDGTTLFVPVPKVTKEHREQLAKNAKVLFHKHKERSKDIQIKCFKKLKNHATLSEDILYNTRIQITNLVDMYIKKLKVIHDEKIIELVKKE